MTEPAQTRRSLIPFYALVALACLVKGPAAIVLAMPCVIAVGIALRRRGEHASLRPLAGTLIAFAITGPWYLAAYLADPAYLRAFIGLHNFARFLGTDELGHQSSIAYYALTLPVALLPWTPLVALGCVRHWRRPTAAHASGDGGVLWTWLASIALVFGAASTRLVTYLLPAFPALFVAAATGLAADSAAHHAAAPRWLGRWTKVWAFFVAATIAASAATALVSLPSVPGVEPRATVALALALVLPLVVSRCVASRWPSAIAIALAAGSFVTAVGAYGPVADLLTGAKGFRVLAAELKPVLPPDSVLSSLSRAPHALAFYLERPIGEVRDLDGARELLDSAAPVFLLTKIRYVDALLNERERGVEVIWRNEQGTTLLVNRAAASAWRRREGVEPSADLYGRQHGFEDRSGHRTRSLSASEKPVAYP